MINTIKKYEELDITNSFMFGKVMRNPRLCKLLLETVLQIKINKIVYLDYEKTLDIAVSQKGVRIDIYVEDSVNSVYNLEMQVQNEGDLPFRSRYYQGIIDLNLLEKGMDYDKLKLSFVIFICMFDPFRCDQYIYTFNNQCEEVKGLTLKDGRTIIFLNANGHKGKVSQELKDLLTYFRSCVPQGELASEIDYEVAIARSNISWRREYMQLQLELQKQFRDGEQKRRKIDLNIITALNSGMSIDKVAEKFQVSVDEVQEIYNAMNNK